MQFTLSEQQVSCVGVSPPTPCISGAKLKKGFQLCSQEAVGVAVRIFLDKVIPISRTTSATSNTGPKSTWKTGIASSLG